MIPTCIHVSSVPEISYRYIVLHVRAGNTLHEVACPSLMYRMSEFYYTQLHATEPQGTTSVAKLVHSYIVTTPY